MSTGTLRTKSQDAYKQLKEWLLAGRLQPGERLVETKVCEELGLRRGPVREALVRLHGEGLLRKEGAYRGHVVEFAEDIPPDQLLYRNELREQIAAGACRLAAKNMNGWEIDDLRALATQADTAFERGEREASYTLNHAFHAFLLEHCGNPLMREVWEQQHLMPPRPRSSTLDEQLAACTRDEDQPSMTDIAEAIAAHDQDLAEAKMKRRVRTVTEALRKIVYRSRPTPSVGNATVGDKS